MKDKSRLVDTAKNCIIVLLFISSVFLLFKAVICTPGSVNESLSKLFGGSPSESSIKSPDSVSSGNAAAPVFILTTANDGPHYAVKYDSQSKEKMISKFSSYLGEALGTAGTLKKISAQQWQTALRGSGVFFDYLYPQPLSAIASWLGYETKGEIASITARRLFLGNSDGKLVLFFISANKGEIFSCNTERSFSSLSSKIAECPIGNAKFAFELGNEFSKLDPYFVFSYESDTLRALEVSNPLRDNFDSSALLDFFGMNKKVASKYTETDGSEVYVDGEKTLRVEASGVIIFSVTGNNGIFITSNSGTLSITDCISSCYQIVENSVALSSGDGVLGLVSVSGSPSTYCNINFGYFVDGIPVTLPDGGYAASFQISGGSIVNATLNCRKYTFSGGTVMPLPEKQATAIAASKGGETILTYEDRTDSVGCSWIFN